MGISDSIYRGYMIGSNMRERSEEEEKKRKKEKALGMSLGEWEAKKEKNEMEMQDLDLAAKKAVATLHNIKRTLMAGNYSPQSVAEAHNQYYINKQAVAPVIGTETDPKVVQFFPAEYNKDGSYKITSDTPVLTFGSQEAMKEWAVNLTNDGDLFGKQFLYDWMLNKNLEKLKQEKEIDTQAKQREAELGLTVPESEKLSRQEKLEKYKQQQANWRTERSASATEKAARTRAIVGDKNDNDKRRRKDLETLGKNIQDMLDEEYADIKLSPDTARKLADVASDPERREAIVGLIKVTTDKNIDPEKRKRAMHALIKAGYASLMSKPHVFMKIFEKIK